MIDYTGIHFFNKEGQELPISLESHTGVIIKNGYGNNAVFHIVCNTDNNICGAVAESKGGRFKKSDFIGLNRHNDGVLTGTLISGNETRDVSIHVHAGVAQSSEGSEYYIDSLTDPYNDLMPYSDNIFPGILISGNLNFSKVSTELVETQTIYMLAETTDSSGNTVMSKISDIPEWSGWRSRYKLMFYIDCRKQKDFRIFRESGDDIIWSNKQLVDLSTDYRIEIGFSGENEGVYTEPIHICVVDTYDTDDANGIGAIYPVGSFIMSAETVGEDERYRTLFGNFGIPDPKTYLSIYKDTDENESKVNMESLNRHSKEMFLTYSEIFPYVGTYKALLNATKVLGYEDIFFKEWYKEIGNNRHLAVDMRLGSDSGDTIIDAMTLEERIHLKKLNWISMMYRLNEEDSSEPRDRYGFPVMKNVYTYSSASSLLKLISLRKWLEKYVTGLHCRIIDIGGEGMYFEKYINGTFGGFQRNISFDHVMNMTPVTDSDPRVLMDSSAEIGVTLTDDDGIMLGSLGKLRFADFSHGYIDISTGTYQESVADTDSSTRIYIGASIGNIGNINKICADAECQCDRFIFKHVISESSSHGLIYEDDELRFLSTDMMIRDKNVVFKKLPTIMLKSASLIREANGGSIEEYIIEPTYTDGTCTCQIKKSGGSSSPAYHDYVSLVPPYYVIGTDDISIIPVNGTAFSMPVTEVFKENDDFTYDFPDTSSEHCGNKSIYKKDVRTYGLRYTVTSDGTPVFKIAGYQTNEHDGFRITDTEYILDIKDGYMVFSDDDNNRQVYINFNYDSSLQTTVPSVTCKYHMGRKYMTTYHDSTLQNPDFHEFTNGFAYPGFVAAYMSDSSTAITKISHIDIPVHGTGNYDIVLHMIDREGVMFSKKSLNQALVIMQEPEITIYSNTSNSNNEFDKDGTPVTASEVAKIKSAYKDHCIMDYAQTHIDITPSSIISDASTISMKYPSPSYDKRMPDKKDYAHLTNTADEFDLIAIDRINEVLRMADGTKSNAKEYFLIAKRNHHKKIDTLKIAEDGDYDALKMAYKRGDVTTSIPGGTTISDVISANTDYIDNPLRVNLIFYNKVGGFPLAQVPAFMANAYALNIAYKKDEYHIYIPNHDANYFIWAKLPPGGSISDGELLTMVVNGVTYYAVTAKDSSGKQYYVRKLDATAGAFERSDILYKGKTLIDDLGIDGIIKDATMNKGITLHVNPAWRVGCTITDVDEDANTMTVVYNSLPYSNMFHTGQMIKLMMDSPFNESYNGQASYKILSVDSTSRTVVLENIANRYYVKPADSFSLCAMINNPKKPISGGQEIREYGIKDGYLTHTDLTTLITTDTFVVNGISYQIEAKYKKDSDGNDDESVIYYAIYVNHVPRNTVYMVLSGNSDRSLSSKCYMAYAHEAFADYDFRIKETESDRLSVTAHMDYTIQKKKLSRYVDKTFGLTYRDFDTDNIGKYWMGYDMVDDVMIPDILDSQAYSYDCPVRFTVKDSKIVLFVDPLSSYITDGIYYTKWKVYKRSDSHNEQELLMVSNNKVLYLDIPDDNIYDVELTLMDKYGSSVTHMIRGFCEVDI